MAAPLSSCQPPPRETVSPGEAERLEARQRADQAERWFAEASRYEASGDLARAEQYYLASLRTGTLPGRVYPALVGVCVRADRFRTAAHYAEQYLAQEPANTRLRYLVATLRVALGQTAKALELLETLLAMEPSFAEAHYLAGVIYLNDLTAFERADAHLRQYLKMAPEGRHAARARAYLFVEREPARSEPL